MPIIKKEEQFPERPVIIVLYGSAGVGKTSLANTATNPILIDCDRGADRAANRADTIVASNWDDVLKDESEFKNYKTVIIDTAKAVLDDYLSIYVVKQDYKLGKNKLKMYGEIGEQFKAFVNRCRALDIDIVIIAHAKEDKDGDVTKFYPDVTGQSKDLILRIADQVGYVSMVNNKRVISFEPTDNRVGKNVAKIDDVEVPESTSPEFEDFMSNITQKVKDSIQSLSKEQAEALEVAKSMQLRIESATNAEQMNEVLIEVNKLNQSQQKVLKNAMVKKGKEIKVEINKTTKKFEDVSSSGNPA